MINRPPAAATPQVKLVVWDLDETLWTGTLSEGPVALGDGRAELLRRLVDQGVMVSISSKNDLAAARAELERQGLWELVVFPRVNWEPKGAQVRDLIEAAQLRAENVLFVDDNHLNREEAAFCAPGLQVADPSEPRFHERMEAVVAAGRPDPDRKRLTEYRMLEAKAEAAAEYGDNTDFLRSCDIRVSLIEGPTADAARIHELIVRTNQLNYTKRRVDETAVASLLADPAVRSVAVRVDDRFGDYGLVGFAAIRGGRVEQLAFSCRILGMGVERAVYEWLGRPAIEVAEPVSAPLDGPDPDWLSIVVADEDGVAPRRVSEAGAERSSAGASILFVGGCDLEAAVAFLDRRDDVATHFNGTPPDRPRLIVHRDSIDYLVSDELPPGVRSRILEEAPFLDASAFDLPDWGTFEHVLYSPLIDYIQAKYATPDLPGVYVSFGDVEHPELDQARIDQLVERYGLDADAVRRFAATWRPVPKPDEVWEGQLHRFLERFRGARSVNVLLGATRTFDSLDTERLATHRHANALVERVVAAHPHAAVVPIDPMIHGREDFTNSIRHYSRRVYRDLALELSRRIGALDVIAEAATSEPKRAKASTAQRTSRAGGARRVAGRALRKAGLR
jgi:FkbH-like protein